LQNFIDVFKDTDIFKTDDVPIQYINMHFLRSNSLYTEKKIKLETNAPVIVYMAVNMRESSPLPGYFEDT